MRLLELASRDVPTAFAPNRSGRRHVACRSDDPILTGRRAIGQSAPVVSRISGVLRNYQASEHVRAEIGNPWRWSVRDRADL
jgi:hypothetical protein